MTPRSNRRKWLFSGCAIVLLLCVVGGGLLAVSSTSANKYIVAVGLPVPDDGFQTGSIYGYDVYVWNCLQGKHIVLYKYSAEMTSGPYIREEANCGEQTPIEIQLAGERSRGLDPRRFW